MIEDKADITFLDLLVVVAANLRLLAIGPVIAGMLVFIACHLVPQSFTSQAILALPTQNLASASLNISAMPSAPQAAAIMVSPVVLDPVIKHLDLAKGQSIQVARRALANRVKTNVGKDGLLRLDVTANSAHDAQAIAGAVIEVWIKSTEPSDQDRGDLNKRLASAKGSLESVNRLLKVLVDENSASLNKPLTRGEAGTSIVAVGELQTRYLSEVLALTRLLQGMPRSVVLQTPTLPIEAVAPQKALIVILTILCSMLSILLWVFIKEAVKKAEKNPATALKIEKLRFWSSLK